MLYSWQVIQHVQLNIASLWILGVGWSRTSKDDIRCYVLIKVNSIKMQGILEPQLTRKCPDLSTATSHRPTADLLQVRKDHVRCSICMESSTMTLYSPACLTLGLLCTTFTYATVSGDSNTGFQQSCFWDKKSICVKIIFNFCCKRINFVWNNMKYYSKASTLYQKN